MRKENDMISDEIFLREPTAEEPVPPTFKVYYYKGRIGIDCTHYETWMAHFTLNRSDILSNVEGWQKFVSQHMTEYAANEVTKFAKRMDKLLVFF